MLSMAIKHHLRHIKQHSDAIEELRGVFRAQRRGEGEIEGLWPNYWLVGRRDQGNLGPQGVRAFCCKGNPRLRLSTQAEGGNPEIYKYLATIQA
jgi:hypothetical protein